MKYRHLFIACLAVASSCFAVENTVVLATRMGYFDTIVRLRQQAMNLLAKTRVGMKIDLQKMRATDRDLRADEFSWQYKNAYFTLEDIIDEKFEGLDKAFTMRARELDMHGAPEAEKRRFITQEIGHAQVSMRSFLKKLDQIVSENPLNIDSV